MAYLRIYFIDYCRILIHEIISYHILHIFKCYLLRSPSIAPAALVVLNTNTLEEEGRIFQDGTGSIQTMNNVSYHSFGPESKTQHTQPNESLYALPYPYFTTHSPPSRSPLFSDGRFLYIISYKKPFPL